MNVSWHADDDLLTRYVSGTVGPLDGASLEQHLTGCAGCRARIATHVEVAPLEMVWSRVREQAQAPAPSLVERLLTRLGVSAPDARLVSVAPSLRTSWLFGLAVTLGFVGLGFVGFLGLLLLTLFTSEVGFAGAPGGRDHERKGAPRALRAREH